MNPLALFLRKLVGATHWLDWLQSSLIVRLTDVIATNGGFKKQRVTVSDL